jgi:site-specific DNA-methyltransferase (adenine-specific)
MNERFLNDRVELHCGDCREVLRELADESIDSAVTDPPYSLVSIVKRFGKEGSAPAQFGADGRYARASAGFMGKAWDTGEVAFDPAFWAEVLRVLKPGGHLLAMGGTRTHHRLACAIEDGGFEIRDCIMWVYGSGFPKSHDVSKGIDRAAGAEREKVRHENPRNPKATGGGRDGMEGATRPWIEQALELGYHEMDGPLPITAEAKQWAGWGTALKPAVEPIVLARKPLSEGTVAANVLKHGTGAINIDACRVATDDGANRARPPRTPNEILGGGKGTNLTASPHNEQGRWPANLILNGSEEIVAAFPDTRISSGGGMKDLHNGKLFQGETNPNITDSCGFGDSGSAARFFFTVKADQDDRLGSKHPTVKPVNLIQYLIRLITPPGGVCLDPFAGTGTLGEAAYREGMRAVLIEREAEYQQDIRRRMALVLAGPDERSRESVKARGRKQDLSDLPLFAASAPSPQWEDMWARPFDLTDAERKNG